jgi:hypothetical protein
MIIFFKGTQVHILPAAILSATARIRHHINPLVQPEEPHDFAQKKMFFQVPGQDSLPLWSRGQRKRRGGDMVELH